MKKLLLVLLSAAMLVSFAACGNEKKNDQPASSVPASSEEISTADESQSIGDLESLKILDSFVNENEVYFDINVSDDVIKDLAITVGSDTFSKSKKVAFNADDAVKAAGEAQDDKKIYVYRVYIKKENNSVSVSNALSKGAKASGLETILQKSYAAVSEGDRAYFAILDTPDGWDKNLSENLNDYLERITGKKP